MKVKTTELIGPALDWMVAACERVYVPARLHNDQLATWFLTHWTAKQGGMNYSTDWSQGGPIIERECIDLVPGKTQWFSHGRIPCYGPTPLIAAMRCYVASKLGDEVEIPDDLIAS